MKRPLDVFDNVPAVEHNVPLPPAPRGGEANFRYAWDAMKPGDSFKVPCRAEKIAQRQRVILECVRYRILKHPSERYTTRKVKGGIRVWRTE